MKSVKKPRSLRVLISRNSAWAIGGAELSAVDQAAVLKSLGHKVYFVSNQKKLRTKLPGSVKFFSWLSIESPRLLRHIRILYLLPFTFIQAAYYAVKLNPDIINPHSREDQIAFTLTKFIHKKPVVWKNAGDLRYQILPHRTSWLAKITQKLLVAALRRADGVYSLNQADNDYLVEHAKGLDSQKLSVIPSSILFSNYKKTSNFKLQTSNFVIGTIIRLHKDKGVQDLIKAFKSLKKDGIELWIVGDGEYRPQLEDLAEADSRIKFLGHQEDISPHLAAMKIFVQPAHKEPWGRNIKEAMYFGKAIVGANTGGIAQQLKDGQAGLLYEPGNAKLLAEKLNRLLDDPKLLNKLSNSAKAAAQDQGDFSQIVETYILPLYRRIAAKKKLLVDATPIVRQKIDGIGRYSRNIVQCLADDYDITLVGFMDDKLPPEYEGKYKFKHFLISRRAYNQLYKLNLAPTAWSVRGVMLCPNFVAFPKTSAKNIVVIHDLAYHTHPQTLTPKNRRYLKEFVPRSLKYAAGIVAVSQATKHKLSEEYKIVPTKISVVPPGIDTDFFKPAEKAEIDELRQRYNLPDKFILFFGTLEPRKNISACLEAYRLLPKGLREKYALVLAGASGWQNQEVRKRIKQMQADGYNLIIAGYIEDKDVPALYSAASAFVFPSLAEGFGIPVLEAMACGTPVITSNIPVLKETAGDAALFADPHQPSEIAGCISTVTEGKQTAAKLVKKGLLRSKEFSWQKSTGLLAALISEKSS